MAIDTAAKRSSALDHEEYWSAGTPFPDGDIGQGDRQHLIWTYSGILIAEAAADVPDVGVIVYGRKSEAVIIGSPSRAVIVGRKSKAVIDGRG